MSTAPKPPVNPAKGNKQGQTTLAAKIYRWQTMSDNLAPHIDAVPQLKDTLAQFQKVIADATALRNQLKVLQASSNDAMSQRNQLLAAGDDLFTRLNLSLQAIHGPQSGKLAEFGIKPRRRPGPRKKSAAGTPDPVPTPEAPSGHGTVATEPAK